MLPRPSTVGPQGAGALPVVGRGDREGLRRPGRRRCRPRGVGVAGDVRQRLADDGEDVRRRSSSTSVSIGPLELERRDRAERVAAAPRRAASSSRRRLRTSASAEACSSKIDSRISRTVRSSSSIVASIRWATSSRSASRATPCSERPVANSRWMTVSWRSRAMRSRSSSSVDLAGRGSCRRALSMATRGRRREADHHLLVDLGELVAAALVGEVEVPVHLAADEQRHAEERAHRRVVRWEADAVGVLA